MGSAYHRLGGVYPIAHFASNLVDLLVEPGSAVNLNVEPLDAPDAHRHEPGLKYMLTELLSRAAQIANVILTGFGGRFGMAICNDRRWAETYRVMGLQGVECVMLGYNTPVLGVNGKPAEQPHLSMFQNHLSMQAGAYQNATVRAASIH